MTETADQDVEKLDTLASTNQGREKTRYKTSRGSRCCSLIVGLVVLAGAVVGVMYILDMAGIDLRGKISSVEFLGTVSTLELQAHDNPSDCWLAFHGSVYDLTEYAPTHPGGEGFITDFCGTDATRDYAREHPESLLKTIDFLRLGVLTDQESTSAATTSSGGTSGGSQHRCTEAEDSDEDEEDAADRQYNAPRCNDAPVNAPATQPTVPQTSQQGGACFMQYYSLQDVSAHTTWDDCWYVLYGTIYDMTGYIDLHPGGSRRIFQHCGTDATAPYAVENRHNRRLLETERMSRYEIGQLGSQTGREEVPCA